MTVKKGVFGTGMTLDLVMCLVLTGFGIAMIAAGAANGGVWLLLLLLGLPLLVLGAIGVALAWKNRL